MPKPLKVKKVTLWECPHCQSHKKLRRDAAEHTAQCNRNPDVHACFTCKHFTFGRRLCSVGLTTLRSYCDRWEIEPK